jgi:predicted helicase
MPKQVHFNADKIRDGLYRPYFRQAMYFDKSLNEMQYQLNKLFRDQENSPTILVSGIPAAKPFQILATDLVPSYDTTEKTECLARHVIASNGDRIDNITDWALDKFTARYAGGVGARAITKDAIFRYVYGVLHDPVYREKYALNLKREFPRMPFYADFWRWADWGEQLMALHIGYESVAPWPLQRLDVADAKARAAGVAPRTVLRADRDSGIIILDSETQLSGIPKEVWDYKLGNRSALDWILDQHKEKTPKDPTIREKFNTYRFADYKEKVVDLLMRVTRVSIESVAITSAMKAAER